MIRCAVVALPVVFPHQLPVAFFDDRRLEGHARFGKAVWRKIRFELPACGCKVRSLRGEADKDVPGHCLTVYGLQTE
jgi:hypothetical protein